MTRLARIRTLTVVTLVSLLIWVWAEGESLSTTQVNARFTVLARGGDLVVQTDDPEFNDSALVTLRGSTNATSLARLQFFEQIDLSPEAGNIPSETGTHTIDLAEIVNAHLKQADVNATVIEVKPATVDITVFRRVGVKLPLRLVLPEWLRLSREARPEPSEATIFCRGETRDQFAEVGELDVEFEERTLRDIPPGTTRTVTGRVTVPTAEGFLDMSPRDVQVRLSVADQIDTFEIPTVPVWVSIAGTNAGKWRVRLPDEDRFLERVTVRGRSEVIAQIRDGKLPVKARVELSSKDLEQGLTSKEVVFDRGPDGSLDFGSTLPQVRLEIEAIDGDEGGNG